MHKFSILYILTQKSFFFYFVHRKYIKSENFNFRSIMIMGLNVLLKRLHNFLIQPFLPGGSTSSTVPNALIFNYTKFDACNPNGKIFSHIRLTTTGFTVIATSAISAVSGICCF